MHFSSKLYNKTEKVARCIILFLRNIREKNYSNSNRTAGGAISKSNVLLRIDTSGLRPYQKKGDISWSK